MTSQLPNPADTTIDPVSGLPLRNPNADMPGQGQPITPEVPQAPVVPAINQDTSTPAHDAGVPQQTAAQVPTAQPTAPAAALTMAQNNSQQYTVLPGDTVNTIAQKLGVSPTSISGYRSGNANRIAVGETLNVAKSPAAQTTTQPTPLPQNQTAQTGAPAPLTDTGKTPFQNVMDTYTQAYQQLGIGDIKSRYTDVLKEQDQIQQELNDKIADVNNNPWLSSASRTDEINKLKDKYTPRLDLATHQAQLYDSLIKEGEQTAQFLVGHVETDTQNAIDTAQKKQDALDKLAQQDIHPADVNGRAVLVDYKTKKIVADLGPSKSGSGTSGGTGTGGDVGGYSTLDIGRYSRAANAIVKNYISLPQYNLTANGLPFLQRIEAADSIPGSVSDAELLDSIVKLNTGGGQVTEAQVKLITDGQSYNDAVNVWKNKLSNGGVLSDSQRTQLTELANKVFDRYKTDYQPIYDQATKQLKDADIPEAFWTIPDLNSLSSQGSSNGQKPTGTSDMGFVESTLNNQGMSYDAALSSVKPGNIGFIDNKTGELLQGLPSDFDPSKYTKL